MTTDNQVAIRNESGVALDKPQQFETALSVSPEYTSKTKQSLAVLSAMVNDLLVEGRDYGAIPGVPDDFLWDAGAALIVSGFNCRYGAPRILKEVFSDTMIAVVIDQPIMSLQTGQEVASCVGAASTTEVKNKYRWVYKSELAEWGYTDDAVIKTLKTKKDKQTGQPYQWRILNPEPAELLNTIWKIAAKRGRVGATKLLPGVASTLAAKFHKDKPVEKKKEPTSDWDKFYAQLNQRGLKHDDACQYLGIASLKDWVKSGKTLDAALVIIDKASGKKDPDDLLDEFEQKTVNGQGESKKEAVSKEKKSPYKREPSSVKTIDELFKAVYEDYKLQPNDVLKELGVKSRTEIVTPPATAYISIACVRIPAAA